MKRLFLLMVFLAVSIQSDAAKMSSYTNNTTPNGDVYFVGVDPNDISQTANGSNYRYSLNSILNLGLLDAVFNSLSIAGTGDSWIELENNTSFSDSIAGKYGLRFYNGALQQIINGTATDIGSASVIQRSSDPIYTDLSTGQIAVSTSSGDLFIKTSTGMYTFAGSYAVDPTPPTFASASIAVNGTTVTAGFSEAVSQGAGYSDTHFNIDASTTGNDIGLTYVLGSGTNSWTFTAASTILQGETVNLDFSGVANSMEDSEGTDMAAVSDYSVTNNSTQTGSLYTTTFSDDFNRGNNTDVITGSSWSSETDAGGIMGIYSNALRIILDSTNAARITKTSITTNNTDYKISYKFKLSNIGQVDTSSTAKSAYLSQLYCAAGLYIQFGIRCNTSGIPYQLVISKYNDAGSPTSTYVDYTFTADTYYTVEICSDIGVESVNDTIVNITIQKDGDQTKTTLLDIINGTDSTRPIMSEIRFGIAYGSTAWNGTETITMEDFVYGYK